MSVWLLASLVLSVGLVPCAAVIARGDGIDALVALELVGTLVTLELVLLAMGLDRTVYFVLPLALPLVGFAGALLLVRVLGEKFL